MERFIVDASVGVKWFFNEKDSELAKELLQRFKRREVRLIVPEFFFIELANVFWKRVKTKETTTGAALDAFDTLIGFSLERYSDHELSDVTFENALHHGISVYDALYLSLAEVYTAPVVTADEVLIKACEGRFDWITSLQEMNG